VADVGANRPAVAFQYFDLAVDGKELFDERAAEVKRAGRSPRPL